MFKPTVLKSADQKKETNQDNLAMNPFLKKSASGNFFEQGHIYPPVVLANRERRASLTNF
jgi:hypothetical protein